MALRGNLRDFAITQLLNIINLAHKTGTLVLEGPGEISRITFREGKLAYAGIGQEDNSLASILLSNHKITPTQHRILKERSANMTDKELGLLLVNAGYLSQGDILESLQTYFTNVIRRLFTWAEGFFHFDAESPLAEDKIFVRMDLENLIIEGARQMKEMEQLQEEIPSLDMALKFTDRPGTNIRNVNLSVEEWRVVSHVNPKNTMRQIAKFSKMNDLEIRRVVYSLLQAGLVEVVRPISVTPTAAATPATPARMFPTNDKVEQKSLVNKLISRIRSL